MWVPSVPIPAELGKPRLCGVTHISTQHKEPSAVHRSWMLKSILDGSNPRSINLANPNRRSPILTQDKRWIWRMPLSNAATNKHNGNPPQFTGISQNLLSFWSVKQLNGFECKVLIEKLSFGSMCMWTKVKGKSKTLALPPPPLVNSLVVKARPQRNFTGQWEIDSLKVKKRLDRGWPQSSNR